MQLNKNVNLKSALTAATCSLLGTQAKADEDNDWKFDTALMYYAENDRVTATEGIISGTKEFKDEHFLNLKFTIDALTGASATGAVAQPVAQTFSRPSGKGSYSISPNETPLDDTFKDTRVQLNAQWTQPLSTDYVSSAGVHLSKEYDYLSLGFNGSISRFFDRKNTTVSAGFSYSHDLIEPEGGINTPFSEMIVPPTGEKDKISNDDSKDTTDLLFGLTQVINRKMIMQLNYSISQAQGYMTDPFKVISVVGLDGYSINQLYENRPDERTKQSVYWQTKYNLAGSVIDFSYRYMWDDWEINSNTFDIRYFIPLGDNYIEPHVRYYMQEAAEFYRPFLLEGEALPQFASADYRIGEMDAITLGIKYGMPLKRGSELSFRLELYKQTPKNAGFEAPGVLQDVELYEEVEAVIAQVSYSF
ncbi:DUF3570 domain-containing protein [Thalassomonas sp. M1454]|uniref:DUF3570 domain-containing protein n=1 Tax=Thalassomonas sp. M1454 TaxID=2594477 RepID=UPI00117E2CF6|nr:DUF3570 domain-containing protein [Thalassomonas sp. M1454]TRX56616.1 DUF3570 domain-containing protein [Thalassomonas sp. M1454]